MNHRLLVLLVVVCAAPGARAWDLFAEETYQEVPLNAAELGHVTIHAGWARDNDHVLLFEIDNQLKGAIQCANAQVELQDGKRMGKAFMPKLFVAPGSVHNASFPGIVKGSLKRYTLECSCLKKEGRGECATPLKK